jgi:Tol biopolymer transport system component
MNRSDPGPEGRVLTVAVGLGVAIAGLVFVVLALRHESAGQQTSEALSSPTGVVGPGRTNGLIAFGCNGRICTMASDGTSVRDLIDDYDKRLIVAGYGPAWSPDGTKIAFTGYDHEGSSSGGGANYDVYVMNADGSDLRNLTKTPDDVARGASQGPPVWSPDGTMFAFEGDDGKNDGLYVMNADGTGFRWLANGLRPAWSPDGNRILFTGMGSDLYSVAADGTDVIQLTNAPGWDDQPSWSPDGSQIAFVRGDDGVTSVLVMAADGSDPRQVFQQEGVYPHQPLWSPDGRRLLLEAETTMPQGNYQSNYDLYLVEADGSRWTDLTQTTERAENWPVWSPDGSLIAFRATTELTVNTDDYQVYLIRPDGSGDERLTTHQYGYSLAWQALR